jgi:hypothetical protein
MEPTSRRAWLAAAITVFAGLWTLRPSAGTAVEQREVSGFDTVVWQAGGELAIEQTGRERLSIEADPAVLAKIVTEVRRGRLVIGFKPGRVVSRETVRFRLEVKSLAALESTGSGTVRIGALSGGDLSLQLAGSDTVQLARLSARTLDVRLAGAGEVVVGGGRVERQRVVITGAANYQAARLDCRDAEVSIDGSGNIEVTARERLVARIAGSGDVVYHGHPRVAETVSGAGTVRQALP